jgi:predicted MarR family transcription regulator
VALFTVPTDFPLAVLERLTATGAPASDRRDALAVLSVILAALEPQSYACRRTVRDLAQMLDLDVAGITRTMKLLAQVAAVTSVRHRRRRRIAVTPAGATRIGRPVQFPPPAVVWGNSPERP